MMVDTEKRLRDFLLISLGVFCAVTVLAILAAYQFRRIDYWVQYTDRLLHNNEQIRISILDLETNQRGYLITESDISFQRYLKTRTTLRQQIASLKGKILTDDARDELFYELEKRVEEKMTFTDETVRVARLGKTESARRMVASGHGNTLMDAVRQTLNQIKNEETERFENRSSRLQHIVLVLALTGCLTVLLFFAFLIWTYFSVKKNIGEKKVADDTILNQSKELKRANRDLEQFAAIAAHDMNEPLRTIVFNLELLKRRNPNLPTDSLNYLNTALGGASRMVKLIKDLLNYSKAGGNELALNPVDCNQALEHVIESLRDSVEKSNARIDFELLPTVLANATLVEQLLQNLVSNSIKYRSDRPPQVRVSSEQKNGEWVFKVEDNGQGIPPESQKRIFEIFQRLHGNEIAGSGIGLATCRRIVERLGGRIWVESEVGKGSRFFFTLPSSVPT